jgi:membrane protein implicated in regulation of membrane protease activity
MGWGGWIIVGLALLGAELMVGTFYLFFLGLAALVVGLISVFGFGGPLWLEALLFLVFSSVLVLAVRRPMLGRLKIQDDKRDIDNLAGEIAVAIEALAPGAIGRVEMRGTGWSGRNVGADVIEAGQRCRVERTDGLMLWVRREATWGADRPTAP